MSLAWDWKGVTIIPAPDKASLCNQITWTQVIRGVSFYSCGKSCKSGTSSDLMLHLSLWQFLLSEGFVRIAIWRIAQWLFKKSWKGCNTCIFGLHEHTLFHFVVACGNGINFAPCWISNLWPGVKQTPSFSRQREQAIFFSVAPMSFLIWESMGMVTGSWDWDF